MNKWNYVETLNLLKNCDPILVEHFGTATVLKGAVSDVQNGLISVIREVVNEPILKEIEETEFMTVKFDETSNVKSRSQLSMVLRYVLKNENYTNKQFNRT